MKRTRVLLCVALLASAGRAAADVLAGGYEPNSCNPRGGLLDNNCSGAFSQCQCTYIPDGSTEVKQCVGAAVSPVAPAGTYYYHRVTMCPPGTGPTYTNPPFAKSPTLPSCGHVRASSYSAPGPPPSPVLPFVITNGVEILGVNDWSHDCHPVADAGPAQTVCPGEPVTLDGQASRDAKGDPLTWAWSQTAGATVSLAGASTATPAFIAPSTLGELSFNLTVRDVYGVRFPARAEGQASDEASVIVRDLAPQVSVADVSAFAPPNHKMVAFDLSECVTSIVDDCDGPLDATSAGHIVGVTSNEPGTDDVSITSDTSVLLRAERLGSGNGRTYTIDFVVADSFGNVTPATCRVTFRHDHRS
jgi:hypothetical protein